MSGNHPLLLVLLALTLSCAFAETAKKPASKPAPHIRQAVTVSHVKTAAKKSSSSKPAVSTRSTRNTAVRTRVVAASNKRSTRRAVPSRPAVQAVPTAERYKEIQEALAQRGYYKGEATGSWNPDSIDALKKFQQEQNLAPSGKLDSVSLIALGLGPKRNLAVNSSPVPISQPRPPQDDHRSSQGSERP
jgi:peptidoglycan hydrolase-like protein with peptidoglycan-binding domain